MSEQDQWRFQWPDGTWIRWNPITQSWEKESPDDPHAAGPALTTVVEEEADPVEEDVDAVVVVEREPLPSRSERRAAPVPAGARRMVSDVVSEENERPRASLWPTVVIGAIAGIGIGLAVLEVIRA